MKVELSIASKELIEVLQQADKSIIEAVKDYKKIDTATVAMTCFTHSAKIFDLLVEKTKDEQNKRTETIG